MRISNLVSTGTSWLRELLAGGAGAMAVLPVVLTLGLLAFSSLGAAAPQVGVFAAFVTAGIGGGVHALISRTTLPVLSLIHI